MQSSFWPQSNGGLGTLNPPGQDQCPLPQRLLFIPGASPPPSKLQTLLLILSANAAAPPPTRSGYSPAYHTVRGHQFSTQHTLPHFFP